VLSVDEPGRPLLHADMLLARYAGLRDQVRAFLTGELEAGSFVPRCDSWLTGFDAQFSRRVGERGWMGAADLLRRGAFGRSVLMAGAAQGVYGNHAIWSERLGSVLAGKDGLTLWQRMTK
jgi:hypothetical protein